MMALFWCGVALVINFAALALLGYIAAKGVEE
jgi:hypothetical protein